MSYRANCAARRERTRPKSKRTRTLRVLLTEYPPPPVYRQWNRTSASLAPP